ncbi:MAG: hypothetical protein AB1585_14475 [Thermodesulfobacteriota bacterium]
MTRIKPAYYYPILILSANIGLLLPPLRFPAAVFLICFLPGYFLVERTSLWKDPLFAAIGSVGLSFLLAPFITLPGCILFQKVNSLILTLSLDLYLIGMLFLLKGRERNPYGEDHHSPFLFPLLLLVCGWVFVYMDFTKLGPYSEDWTYLFGVVKELSRNMPPRDPEASFLLLKYPWVSYFFFALIHRLGGVSAWKVLEFMPTLLSFIFLGVVYMILFQATKNRMAGLWAILFLAVGRETEWIFRGFLGLGWSPGYHLDPGWAELLTFTGYSLLWGWYLLPSMIPPLMAWFFLVRYEQESQKKDYWFSLGICAASCFFHPAYYLGFLIGFSCWLVFQWLTKKFDLWLLLFYFSFIPYYVTFFLYFQPGIPSDPFFQFFATKKDFLDAIWEFLRYNAIVIPFFLWALFVSREVRLWLLPFAGPFVFFSVFGRSKINHLSHFIFPCLVYLSLVSAVGLTTLKRIPLFFRVLVYFLTVVVITVPFYSHVSHRLSIGWEGALDMEQRAAGEYIRLYSDKNSTFVILPDSRYSAVCVEGLGERKIVFGWFFHLSRYETVDFLYKKVYEVVDFFVSGHSPFRYAFLKKNKADYIFLGPDEIAYMKQHDVDVSKFVGAYRTVFKSPRIEIVKVDRGEL